MDQKNIITSRENQKLKYARRVREGKERDAVFVEGLRLAEEVLRSNTEIIEVFIDENFTDSERADNLIIKLNAAGKNLNTVENRIFPSIAETGSSQGIVLIAEKPATGEENFLSKVKQNPSKSFLSIFLSEVNNPSNLGAILRTAEAAGVAGIIISKKSADAFSPKATRAALGANLRLPIWENAQFEKVLNWASATNSVTTAADVNARKKYTEIDWTQPRLLIFGSEAHGLSEEARRNIEELIFIPMQNEVESLNLAVSCGIILFEARRQMRF